MNILYAFIAVVIFCSLHSNCQDIDPNSFDFDDFDASTPKFEYTTIDPYSIFPTSKFDPETTKKEKLDTTTKPFSEWPIDSALNSAEVDQSPSDESSREITTKLDKADEATEQTTVETVTKLPDNSDENVVKITEAPTTPDEQEKKDTELEKTSDEDIQKPQEPKIYFQPETSCEENCGKCEDDCDENTIGTTDDFGSDFRPIAVPDAVIKIFQQLGNWRVVGLADPLSTEATTTTEPPEQHETFNFRYNLTPMAPVPQECYYKVKDGPYWMNEDIEYGRLFDESSVRRCYHCCETSIFERCSQTYLSNCGLNADNIQHSVSSNDWYNSIYPNNYNRRTCKLVTYWLSGTQVRKIIC